MGITFMAPPSMYLSSERHTGDFWLDLLSPLTELWHGLSNATFPAPVQAGSWIRREQHHSGEIHEPPEKEHSRPFQEINLLHPVYLSHESCRAVIFHTDTTNTTY